MATLRYGTAGEAGFNEMQLQKARKLVAGWAEQNEQDYATWMVAHKGIIIADESVKIPNQRIFPVASISKVVTATAAMFLADDGLLSLTRRVSEYIPEFIGDGKHEVMVYHLMTHSSGLEDNSIYENMKQNQGKVDLADCPDNQHPRLFERLQSGYGAPLQSKPGTRMSYCGFGFELLSEIIRRLSGQNLAAFAKARLFVPLGMEDSFYSVPDEAKSRLLQIPDGYEFAGLNSVERLAVPDAANGMYSTTADLLKFGQMFLNKGIYHDKRILSEATIRAMTRNQIPGISSYYGEEVFKEANWGLGWSLSGEKRDESGTLRSPQTFSHSGAGCSFLLVDPVNAIVISCFIPTKQYITHFDRKFDYLSDVIIAGVERCGS
ncbi:serine hydrolase domain-containing protein [Paenibacillus gansuensis]|uniref:Serine hydrolase domain-containing protein n=1 Tax=Paenibacillus gansuensis TaxID=306542 RepID=A0ABW5P916_9BACL